MYSVRDDKEEFSVDPFRRKSDGEIWSRYQNDKKIYMKEHWFINFTTSKVPWSNQVHHVLNQSSLSSVIDSYENVKDVIRQGLYEELYNVNHKDNMIILPTNEKWSRIIGLPVHSSHPNYNMKIIADVQKALKGYEQINAKAANKSHPKADPVAVKERLLKISKKWYGKILKAVDNNKNVNKPLVKINKVR